MADVNIKVYHTDSSGDLLEPQPLLVSQGAFENKQLHSNNQTDAEYTATNVTPSQDQTGLDGKPNNACKLVATGANGTVIGSAITAASGTHAIAVYLQRETGSGDIDLTLDNGSTWTTVPVTAAMNRFLLDQAALTNPQMGTRIVTDTDAVIVGNDECYLNTTAEELKLLNGPIYTTSASVAIDAVRPTFDTENHVNSSGQYSGYFYFDGPDTAVISIAGVPVLYVTSDNCILADGTDTTSLACIVGVNHFVVTYNAAAATMGLYLNGAWATAATYDGSFGLGAVTFGANTREIKRAGGGDAEAEFQEQAIKVMRSDGTEVYVSRSVLNSDGVPFEVSKTVLDKDGNEFEVQ